MDWGRLSSVKRTSLPFWVVIVALCSILTIHFTELEATVGDPCTDPSNCTSGEHEICSNDTCACDQGYVADGNSCKPEHSYGDTCDQSVANQCEADLICNTTKICGCGADDYYDSNGGQELCKAKHSYGDTCNQSVSDQCVADLICTITNICGCGADDYYDSNDGQDLCKAKHSYGDTCNQSVSDQCVADLICTTTNICGCGADDYYDSNGGQEMCKAKVTHGKECNPTIPDMCQDGSTSCSQDNSHVFRCLCDSLSYFNSVTCSSLSELKVTGITTDSNTTSVRLFWKADKHGTNVTYEVQPSPSGGHVGTATERGVTVTGLTFGTLYSFSVTSVLPASLYYSEKRTLAESQPEVWTKIAHGDPCTPGSPTDNICEDINATCITAAASGGFRCLCSDGFYRNPADSECRNVNELKVNIIVQSWNTTSVTLSWTANKYGTNVSYTIQSSPGGGSVGPIDVNPWIVYDLDPGTKYTFTVTSTLPAFGYYSAKTVTADSQPEVWTKPAKPGAVEEPLLMSKPPPYYVYHITFAKSAGNVYRYVMVVNSQTGTSTGKPTTFSFNNLIPAQNYSYSITAYNGNGNASEISSGYVKTPPEVSGPVTSFTYNATSYTTAVGWKPPSDPNGEITDYVLRVEEDGECVFGTAVCRSSCSQTIQADVSDCMVKKNETFPSQPTDFAVNITNLKPYHNYTVNVRAVNERGFGTPFIQAFRTAIAAARDVNVTKPLSMRDPGTGKVSLEVTWTPGEFTGPTRYEVCVEKKVSLNSSDFDGCFLHTVDGYSTNTSLWPDVLASWTYQVYVKAMTDAGNSSRVGPVEILTATNYPGMVKTFSLTQDASEAQEMTITIACPEETARNGSIVGFIVRKTLLDSDGGQESSENFTVNQEAPLSCNSVYNYKAGAVGGIKVDRNYSFQVSVQNNDFNGSFSKEEPFHVEPRAPQLEKALTIYSKTSMVSKDDGSTLAETKINLLVCAACLLDERQGRVERVGLIVCKVGADRECGSQGQRKRSLKEFGEYITWAKAKEQTFKQEYRATPDNWSSLLNAQDPDMKFVIGIDKCDQSSETTYCNGPLPDGSEFRVAVIKCNVVGCVVGNYDGPFITKAVVDGPPTAAIAAGIAVPLVLIIIAVVIVFMWRRRRQPRKPTRSSNPIWEMDERSREDHIRQSRPVRIRDFKEHVTKMHKDSNLLFQDEFEDIKKLCAKLQHTVNEAQREGNRVKNRYVDILPFDHSRVKLSVQPEDDDTMDFINANYIPGINGVREYIATQGPMHCTIPDFWRMAWEQKCKVIVMLSDLQENGKRKVDLYWPENLNEPINYGSVVVEMTNFSQLNKYIIRNFVVTRGDESRKMTHFFLPGWWDFSANLTVDDVLEFAKLVRQEATPANTGPIIVHCSAGVGRTGTLIALDYFMQYVDRHSLDDEVDIFSYVMEMRKHRPRMVQAETQYIFIFDALQEIIQKKIKAEEERLYDNLGSGNNVYANMGQQPEENIYANATSKNGMYAYDNEAFEPPEYQNMEVNQTKASKPTTEL